MGPLLFLLLPALAFCADINLVFKDFSPNITGSVDVQGNITHQMTVNEMATLFLTNEVLMDIAKKVHAQGTPLEVYLHGPTSSWTDVYSSRNLKPVSIKVTPTGYDIFCNFPKEVVLHTVKVTHGDTSKHVLTGSATDSIKAKWYTAGPIEGSRDVHYSVVPHHYAPTFNIDSKWGVDFDNSRKLEFKHDVELFLNKNEVRDLVLSVTKVNAEVVVTFSITVEGSAVCNIDSTFYDHPIIDMLNKAKHPTTTMASLVVSFDIHTDGMMVAKDPKTGETKLHYGVYPAVV